MLKPSILRSLRKATELEISISPVEIILQPEKQKVKVGGGIYNSVDVAPRPKQTFTVEPVGATLSGITGVSGGQVKVEGASGYSFAYNIKGKYDCQMEIGDSWKFGSTLYRIISIQPENGYEKVGVVVALGSDPSYG